MKEFAIYNKKTGSIRVVVTGADENFADINAYEGERIYEGDANDEYNWIDPETGERQDRQEMNPNIETSTGQCTLSNLPDPCTVRVLGSVNEVKGGSETIEFDEPGTYTIELSSPPQYLDHSLEVDIP